MRALRGREEARTRIAKLVDANLLHYTLRAGEEVNKSYENSKKVAASEGNPAEGDLCTSEIPHQGRAVSSR
jgi:hypothetical protein